MTKLVSCRGLICRLGNQLVLNNTDFDLSHGESVALLGSSGSGKTTLLRVIAGLEVAEHGEVQIDGTPASKDGRLLVPPHRHFQVLRPSVFSPASSNTLSSG